MRHRCCCRVFGLTERSASMAWNVYGSIIGRIMSALEALGRHLSMIGRRMLRTLSGIWQSAFERIEDAWLRLKQRR